MGGGFAFYNAVKYPELFSSVTTYAGTYHHYYHEDYETVGVPSEKAAELYKQMISEAKYGKARHYEKNILELLSQNAVKIRDNLRITIHIGTDDVLYCDNEILRLHLNALNIPHEYRKFYGVEHDLSCIVLKEREHKEKPMMLKHNGTVTLKTKRLVLRRFTIDDFEPMYYNCWNDPDVWKWTNYEPMDSIDDVVTLNNIFTDHWFSRYEKSDWYNWAIQLKSSGDVIGRLRGMNINERIGQIELAYELGKNWWNQGIMTEAVSAVIDFFINTVGFNRVYAAHAHENPASGKVMKKCGMIFEGTARQACKCNNGTFDMVNYAILADEFNKK
jgi:ribosomal-protein-alanine N-acetyltransferase